MVVSESIGYASGVVELGKKIENDPNKLQEGWGDPAKVNFEMLNNIYYISQTKIQIGFKTNWVFKLI